MNKLQLLILGLGLFMLAMVPANSAHAADFDPCIPEICDHVERLVEQAKDVFVQQAIDAIDTPKHVKEVMDCLDQLINIAMSIGLTLMWPDFSAILSQIIDNLCQQITSKWEAIISQLSASFQLPEIPITVFGHTYTDWIVGGISVGVTSGSGVPGGSIEMELVTPVDTTYIKSPGFGIP